MNSHAHYVVRLEGPFSTPEAIQTSLGCSKIPPVFKADIDNDNSQVESGAQTLFCKLSAKEKAQLLDFVARNHLRFRPTIARLAKAVKKLGDNTVAPCLGLENDTTLPHKRPSVETVSRPRQYEYPVWNFFYGKLAQAEVLKLLFNLEAEPILTPATVFGGKIKRWGGKYNAVVDTGSEDSVDGFAYLLETKEREEALLFFETDIYEVVQCKIRMPNAVVDGLVFRFCGDFEQLT